MSKKGRPMQPGDRLWVTREIVRSCGVHPLGSMSPIESTGERERGEGSSGQQTSSWALSKRPLVDPMAILRAQLSLLEDQTYYPQRRLLLSVQRDASPQSRQDSTTITIEWLGCEGWQS